MEVRVDLLVGIPKGSVVDVETTALEPKEGDLISFGWIQGDRLTILVRTSESAAEYYRNLRETVARLPEPFYAYNVAFERSWVETKLGLRPQVVDLMAPWAERARQKNVKMPGLHELISDPESVFGDRIVLGSDVPEIWRRYQRTQSREYLGYIVRHTKGDLLRALYLLIFYPHGEIGTYVLATPTA